MYVNLSILLLLYIFFIINSTLDFTDLALYKFLLLLLLLFDEISARN